MIRVRPSGRLRRMGALPKSMSGRGCQDRFRLIGGRNIGAIAARAISDIGILCHDLFRPETLARVEVECDDGVGSVDRRIGVAIAGRDVERFAFQVDRGRRPDAGAGGPPQLRAFGGFFRGRGSRALCRPSIFVYQRVRRRRRHYREKCNTDSWDCLLRILRVTRRARIGGLVLTSERP